MTKTTIVGFCFLTALGLFLFAAVTIQGVNPFGPDPFEMTVTFSTVSGLKEGDNIRVRGLDVGKVEQTSYTDDGIVVSLRLDQEIPPREGYRFTVMPASALGGNFIDYIPGDGIKLPSGQPLQGDGTADLLTAAGQWFEENAGEISAIIANIKAVTERLEQGTGVIGRLVAHEETQQKFDEIVESIRSVSSKVDTGDNLLGALLNQSEYADRFDRILANVEEISRKGNEGEGPLGVLLNDAEVGNAIKTIVSNLESTTTDLRDQNGILGRLISDPEYGKELESILVNVESFTGAIAKGPGTVHDLLYDETLRGEVRGIFTDIALATRQLGPDGEGTLAELLHGRDLAADIRGTITLLRESVEDTREMAPLNTFVNILFSAF